MLRMKQQEEASKQGAICSRTVWRNTLTNVETYRPVGSHATLVHMRCSW